MEDRKIKFWFRRGKARIPVYEGESFKETFARIKQYNLHIENIRFKGKSDRKISELKANIRSRLNRKNENNLNNNDLKSELAKRLNKEDKNLLKKDEVVEDKIDKKFYEQAEQPAKEIFEVAKQHEPDITKALIEIEKDTSGVFNYPVMVDGKQMESFDFKVKSVDSLKNKIAIALNKGKEIDKIKADLFDTVRYTLKSDKENLVNDFNIFKDKIKNHGIEFVEIKNYYQIKNSSYYGVNCKMIDKNGYQFEVQFHTQKSLEVKDKNHKLYDIQKKYKPNSEKYNDLKIEMMSNAKEVIFPDNILNIKPFKVSKK